MAKQTRSHKQTQLQSHQGKGYQQERTEVFDDNLLLDAAEISALSQIDPTIINWLKERAEKEQEFRQNAFNSRTKILERDVKC